MFPLWLYNTCRTMAGREARKRLHVEVSDYDLPDSQHQRGEIDHILEAPPVEYYVEQQCAPCACLLYTSPSPRDATLSRMPSSA